MNQPSANLNRLEAAAGRYRPDIDGLRAVAVLPVVLYHFGVAPFGGGFVGVDIFFVISGFLITAMIHAEMRENRFSLVGFYERRVRRILPAMFAMMAFCSVAALVVLFPDALVAYAKSLIATAAFVSDFQFWSEASYFDIGASQKPLLHTWSLAVEEQFYLVFPALLWLLRKARERVLLLSLAILLVLSLAASLWAVNEAPVSAFYLLPFRFWELALGGVLAVGRFAVPGNSLARNGVAFGGLALIAGSVFALTSASPFPGLNALPPCLGAALIIYAGAGQPTVVSAALGARAPVFIGLISYSLYLWHWPLYVFAKYAAPAGELGPLATAALIALSVLLAVLSWHYVERPFRGRDALVSRKRLFALAGLAIAVAAVVGAVMWTGNGLPGRYSPDIRAILAAGRNPNRAAVRCFSRSPEAVAAANLCTIGNPNVAPSFILWGDSHSEAMLPAISAAAASKGRAGLFAGHGFCAPLAGVTRLDVARCTPFNDAVLKLALRPAITEIVLDARWARDAGAAPLGPDDRGRAIVLFDDQSKERSVAQTPAVFARGLERTVKILTAAGEKVVIVASVPENSVNVPIELAKMKLSGLHWRIEPALPQFLARQSAVFSVFRALKARYGVTILYPHLVLCGPATCAVARGGQPLYRDSHHLSIFGAKLMVPMLAPVF
jgi:peptidoglycan/LPS O-acetylase OafA/YrhL